MTEALQSTQSISVYDGVDRELYKTGAAVTSQMLRETQANQELYNQAYGAGGMNKWAIIGLSSGVLITGVGLGIMATKLSRGLLYNALDTVTENYSYPAGKVGEYLRSHFKSVKNGFGDAIRYEDYSKISAVLDDGPTGTYST